MTRLLLLLALLVTPGCATLVLPGAICNQYNIVKVPIAIKAQQSIDEDIRLSDLAKGNRQDGGTTSATLP